MAEFAIVQDAMLTGGGPTQDFTVLGFGTPKGAIFFASYGTVNGTAVSHAMMSIGATDGTRSRCMAQASENAQPATDTGMVGNTTHCILSLLNTTQALDGSASFDSWITDGVRITWTDFPPAAYLLNVILIGGSGVSNVYVDNAATPTVVNTATDVTAPGFQPDILFGWSNTETSLTTGAHGRPTAGVAVRTPQSQRSAGLYDVNASDPTSVLSRLQSTAFIFGMNVSAYIEVMDYDSLGFSLYLRSTGGTAIGVNYVAIGLNSINAVTVVSASPIATGDHTITGAGMTPQFGLMLHTENLTTDTTANADDGEVFGISAFTTAASASSAIYIEDNLAANTTTESITDYGTTTSGKPVRLRKNSADFMTATFSAFTSDGVTFNYSVTSGSARQRAVMFVGANDGAAFTAPIALQQTGGVMIGRRYV